MRINIRSIIICLTVLVCGSVSCALAGPLAKISIVPPEVGLVVGAAQQFKVIGENAEGNEVPVQGTISWSTTIPGCMLTSNGLFTASRAFGKHMNEISVSVSGGLTANASVEIFPNTSQSGYVIERSIGGLHLGAFDEPLDVAVDGAGNIYCVSGTAGIIDKFNPSTGRTTIIKLSSPISNYATLAVDTSGNVFVLDILNRHVFKYSSSGALIAQWGSYGSGDGQFSEPYDIAVDTSGNVFVSDRGNYDISTFDNSGTFIRRWHPWYANRYCSGCYCGVPRGIAPGMNGGIYVISFSYDWDTEDHLLVRHDANGNLLDAVNIADMYYNVGNTPMAVDTQGALYTLDDYVVCKFSGSASNPKSYYESDNWGNFGYGDGEFRMPSGIAADKNGSIFASDQGTGRVQVFDGAGNLTAVWGSSGSEKGRFNNPSAIALDNQGNIYIGDSGNRRIQIFNLGGTYINEIASIRKKDGAFACSGGLAADNLGRLYTTDTPRNRILSYASDGSLLSIWNLPASSGTEGSPLGITRNSAGYILMTDSNACTICKLDSSGNIINTWSGPGSTDGKFNAPAGIDIDSKGSIFVADYGNNRIQKFLSSGAYTYRWGIPGSGDGQFNGPAGLCIGSADEVFVADSGNNRIQRFNSSAGFISKIGSAGSGQFEFLYPQGVVVDNSGSLYVADTGNNRLVKLVPTKAAGTLKDSKTASDGCWASLSGVIISAAYKNSFYIESKDRTCGIRIDKAVHGRSAKTMVNISGTISTDTNGEGYIAASSIASAGTDSVKPLGMPGKTIGGGPWPYIAGQDGVIGGTGPNNIGLLVRTFGRVTYSASDCFYVDDGSGLTDASGRKGIKVIPPATSVPAKGAYVQVEGASSCYKEANGLRPMIRATTWLTR